MTYILIISQVWVDPQNISITKYLVSDFLLDSIITSLFCFDNMSSVVDSTGEIFNNNLQALVPTTVGSQVVLMSVISVYNTYWSLAAYFYGNLLTDCHYLIF